MKTTDIIRNVLDLIDNIDCSKKDDEISNDSSEQIETGLDQNRFRQIFDLLSKEHEQTYNNSPAEQIASIDAVTVHAGGGWNGPKNPSDMRSNTSSLFPGYQAENKGQE